MLPRAARLTNALRDRRRTLAVAGAAAALAGAGAGTAIGLAPSGHTAAPADRPSLTAVRHDATTAAASASATAAHAASRHASPARLPNRSVTGVRVAADTHRDAKPAPAKPYLIYDSVTPSSIPAHHEVATYATGGYAVPASSVSGRHVLWIDTNGSDPHASALDVEPGDATPSAAAAWTRAKLTAEPNSLAHIYTMRSDWPAVKAAVSSLPSRMQSHVRWWIADPTGVPHQVPGASATQWYWGPNYDITTAAPGFQ
jgi:hypothetical protein